MRPLLFLHLPNGGGKNTRQHVEDSEDDKDNYVYHCQDVTVVPLSLHKSGNSSIGVDHFFFSFQMAEAETYDANNQHAVTMIIMMCDSSHDNH